MLGVPKARKASLKDWKPQIQLLVGVKRRKASGLTCPSMAMLVEVKVDYEMHSALCLRPSEGAGVTGRATGFYSQSYTFMLLSFPHWRAES